MRRLGQKLGLMVSVGGMLAAGTCLAAPAYHLAGTVTLPHAGGWDYLTFDPTSGHVLVAEGDQTTVIDPAHGVVGALEGLSGAHGQVVANGAIWSDSGEAGTVTMFDAASYKRLAVIPATGDADGMTYDASTGLLGVAGGDSQSLALIDTKTRSRRAVVALGAEPEGPASDGHGSFYVNLASANAVAKVDEASAKLVARYAIPDCHRPHGIAVDPVAGRVFVSCVNAKLVAIDTASGHEVQRLPIGLGTDAATIDTGRHLVFSSNGIAGTLSVFREAADGTLSKLAEVKTRTGARTLAEDPASGRVFSVTATTIGKRVPGHYPDYVAGSKRLLIYAPAS
ncbi:MAG: hypothetical protein POG24_08000 [Acidocella sp.]|nr:hypothetical protein [Acidocella sp.]